MSMGKLVSSLRNATDAGDVMVGRLVSVWPLMAMYTVLLCLSAYFVTDFQEPPSVKVVKCFVRSFYVIVLLSLWSSRFKAVKYVSVVSLGLLFFVDLYCRAHLHCRVNASIVFLILQTDPGEATEYLSVFLPTLATLKAFGAALLVSVAGIVGQRCLASRVDASSVARRLGRMSMPVRVAVQVSIGVMLCVSVINTFVWWMSFSSVVAWSVVIVAALLSFSWIVSSVGLSCRYRAVSRIAAPLSVVLLIMSVCPEMIPADGASLLKDKAHNSLQNLANSVYDVLASGVDMERLVAANRDAVVATSGEKAAFKVVVVIGESFSKRHSSLYGYGLETNPLLGKERDAGNLYLFNDAFTPSESTAFVMMGVLSTHCKLSSDRWDDYPLFPALLRKGGYSVALIDNQGTMNESDAWQFHSSSFFSSAEMSSLCFDMRNDRRFRYDKEALDCYLDSFSRADVCVIHLMGQHVNARMRYPEGSGFFSEDDYADRTELDSRMRMTVADYDNATRYNDSVVGGIIDSYRQEDAVLFYFSDHGEEVYDYRDRYGRAQGELTPEYLSCVYEIPYMVWVSDEFKNRHPELSAKMASSVNLPVTHFDFSHLILDLCGVSFPQKDLRRSFLSDSYGSGRRRYYMTGGSYDARAVVDDGCE